MRDTGVQYRVEEYLRANPDKPLSTGQIARAIRANPGSIPPSVTRLIVEGCPVTRPRRGVYVWANGGSPEPSHGTGRIFEEIGVVPGTENHLVVDEEGEVFLLQPLKK